MTRGNIKITSVLIALVMIGFLVQGMYAFIADLGQGYNTTVEEEEKYNQLFQQSNSISQNLSASYNNVTQQEISKTSAFFIGANLAWNGLKTAMLAPMRLLTGMTTIAAENVIGVPGWAIGLATVFVTIIVLMAALAFLRGWQP